MDGWIVFGTMANLGLISTARSVSIQKRRLRAGGVTGVKRGPAQAIRWREMSLRIDSEAWIRREGREEVAEGLLVGAGSLAQRVREHGAQQGKLRELR